MYEVKKIDIMSTAKMYGAIGAIIGFVIGLFVSIFAFAFAPFAGAGMVATDGVMPINFFPMMMGVMGIIAIIALPIIYGVICFILGAIVAFLYNIVAERIGGIAVEFGGASLPASKSSSSPGLPKVGPSRQPARKRR